MATNVVQLRWGSESNLHDACVAHVPRQHNSLDTPQIGCALMPMPNFVPPMFALSGFPYAAFYPPFLPYLGPMAELYFPLAGSLLPATFHMDSADCAQPCESCNSNGSAHTRALPAIEIKGTTSRTAAGLAYRCDPSSRSSLESSSRSTATPAPAEDLATESHPSTVALPDIGSSRPDRTPSCYGAGSLCCSELTLASKTSAAMGHADGGAAAAATERQQPTVPSPAHDARVRPEDDPLRLPHQEVLELAMECLEVVVPATAATMTRGAPPPPLPLSATLASPNPTHDCQMFALTATACTGREIGGGGDGAGTAGGCDCQGLGPAFGVEQAIGLGPAFGGEQAIGLGPAFGGEQAMARVCMDSGSCGTPDGCLGLQSSSAATARGGPGGPGGPLVTTRDVASGVCRGEDEDSAGGLAPPQLASGGVAASQSLSAPSWSPRSRAQVRAAAGRLPLHAVSGGLIWVDARRYGAILRRRGQRQINAAGCLGGRAVSRSCGKAGRARGVGGVLAATSARIEKQHSGGCNRSLGLLLVGSSSGSLHSRSAAEQGDCSTHSRSPPNAACAASGGAAGVQDACGSSDASPFSTAAAAAAMSGVALAAAVVGPAMWCPPVADGAVVPTGSTRAALEAELRAVLAEETGELMMCESSEDGSEAGQGMERDGAMLVNEEGQESEGGTTAVRCGEEEMEEETEEQGVSGLLCDY